MKSGRAGREGAAGDRKPVGALIGRQPIVDRRERVVAYELLFRADPDATTAEFEDMSFASTRVAVNAFLAMGAQTAWAADSSRVGSRCSCSVEATRTACGARCS